MSSRRTTVKKKKKGLQKREQEPKLSVMSWMFREIVATKLRVLTAVLVLLGAIPAAMAGVTYVSSYTEPSWIALRYWVREQLEPIIKVQETQSVGLDRFLLFQQQQALAKAHEDPGAASSPIVKERVQVLEKQIKDTRSRICKSTRKNADCD